MSSSTDDSATLTHNLYTGWMTGYCCERSEDLYFHRGPLSKLSDRDRRSLKRSLHTYLTLAGVLGVSNDSGVIDGLNKMIQDVARGTDERSLDKPAPFESWYDSVVGALRAKLPSAYHAAGFVRIAYSLGYASTAAGAMHKLQHDLKQFWLLKLKKSISDEAFDVINNDINRVSEELKLLGKPTEDLERLNAYRSTFLDDWGGLILGDISAIDLLDKKQKLGLWLMAAGVGVCIGLGVAVLVLIPFVVVSWVAKVNTMNLTLDIVSNLFSTVQTLIALLTAVGVSLAFLVKKAFDGFRASVSLLTVFVAGRRSLQSKGESDGGTA